MAVGTTYAVTNTKGGGSLRPGLVAVARRGPVQSWVATRAPIIRCLNLARLSADEAVPPSLRGNALYFLCHPARCHTLRTRDGSYRGGVRVSESGVPASSAPAAIHDNQCI